MRKQIPTLALMAALVAAVFVALPSEALAQYGHHYRHGYGHGHRYGHGHGYYGHGYGYGGHRPYGYGAYRPNSGRGRIEIRPKALRDEAQVHVNEAPVGVVDDFEWVPGSVPEAAAVELERVTVPAGTRLMIGLDDELDTGENKDGDRFSGFLDAALSVDGKTVVPRGTKLYGRLREVEKAGRFRGKAELVLELTDIRLDAQLIPIVTDRIRIDGEKAKTLQKVGGAAVAGAVLGAVVDGAGGAARGVAIGAGAGTVLAAITGGRQVKLEPETLLEFRLDQEVTVNAP